MSHVTFAGTGSRDDMDLDELTDNMLLREKNTISKAKMKRLKIMSVFHGNYQSRKKIFSEIQENADYKIYEISVLGTTIRCAKVFNPALLGKNSQVWSKLAEIQRFELEDPEGLLTAIPKHYANCFQRLESFSMTWTHVKTLPNELFRKGLRSLVLQRNHIKTLTGIERASDLSNLDVSSNLLTELPKAFGQLQSLTNLNISGNAIKELPENFGSLSQLRVLDCSCNRLARLPESVENLLELTSLDVSNNHLVAFPETLGNMPRLEDLRARGNQLEILPQKFQRLARLTSLMLRKNKFKEVPVQLSNIASLQILNMADNSVNLMPREIPSLKTLILDNNSLEEISDEILKCTNVQMLSLQHNKISSIPDGIMLLRSVRVLHLTGNPISEVSENIGKLEHLRHLSLRLTKIRRLPMAIVEMRNLVQLDIDDCKDLEDVYLKMELVENGLEGLRSYMRRNAPVTVIEPARGMTIQPGIAQEPTTGGEASTELVHNDRDTVLLFQSSVKTMPPKPAPKPKTGGESSAKLFDNGRKTIWPFLASSQSSPEQRLPEKKTDQIGLNTIQECETAHQEHQEPDSASGGADAMVTYGTVNKPKGQKGVGGVDQDELNLVIERRGLGHDLGSSGKKRQSKV